MKTSAFRALLLSSILALSTSCSLMEPSRSFIDEMEGQNDAFLAPGKDFPVVGGDTGEMRRSREQIDARTPASERTKRLRSESNSIGLELNEKEDRLGEEERERYSRDKKFLQTDSDKLYYLSLSPYDRGTYIDTKKSDLRDDLAPKRNLMAKHSIHSSELFLGMAKAEVIEMWGKPARVEIAGNPTNQNERWSFVEDGSVKQVYFEGGKVQGWALDL
ncbi:MAG: hypothetical protein H7336_17105 [Bacteriovorax sp.]|nr:hypothetical protein [Bacteriovorax sp.]